ncbi:motile sperm domain-containing protein 2-like [Panonychus citri]|uniref:motile sperm domain-containing protein 2-like n=1 Tax=Panonychus citri TaxID=50023 RepID=UPI002307785F|nr:motile sperm domain-containing protein 2-like [Panonychus citri]XP_053213511.1 motile sperm domain-containing protein 2-like [Panonychus citri]XP_053213512.1 motile sperm domain-containing protein 2-like [Panonychus citri]XP_053213513.1 motile sperm domain-containing protein 2-like [Panonychus citri]XP_053213514.1 motile sperm domain-containing protein 2-like [Panonychus citri]XP_053213515.1 motile sperm domain-containing protein 2-like [Panonychus citri]
MIRERLTEPIDKNALDQLKKHFFERVANEPDQYDPIDLERIEKDDWWVYRFLAGNLLNHETALEAMIESMKWRKSHGFRSFKMNYFPDMFFKTGALFQYETDKQGRPSLILRIKFVRKIKDIQSAIEQFVDHVLWSIDEDSNGNGWILIFDFKDAGLQNADFDLLHYLINDLKIHFPLGIDAVLVVDLPWILKAFWSMVKTWIPNEGGDLVQFTTRKKLKDHFDESNLPDFLDGKCKRPYKGDRMVPNGSPDVYHFGSKVMNVPANKIESIVKIYESIMT